MKKILLKTCFILTGVYLLICLLLYTFQEKLIFFPQKLEKSFQFQFDPSFIEKNIRTNDHKLLNGVLFKADSSKGLIFYLHGNAGCLSTWGEVAKTYTEKHYDVFILDYPGYGKSEGEIESEKDLHQNIQTVYEEVKKEYDESKIIVLGYSIGTGLAARLAANNSPGLLILQAPYYSLTDLMRHTYSIIPTFLLKYKFDTYRFLKECNMPVIIFHGNKDEVIYYESSTKLQQENKQKVQLITLQGQGHNGMTDNEEYQIEINNILMNH